jgi:hypothetical protein
MLTGYRNAGAGRSALEVSLLAPGRWTRGFPGGRRIRSSGQPSSRKCGDWESRRNQLNQLEVHQTPIGLDHRTPLILSSLKKGTNPRQLPLSPHGNRLIAYPGDNFGPRFAQCFSASTKERASARANRPCGGALDSGGQGTRRAAGYYCGVPPRCGRRFFAVAESDRPRSAHLADLSKIPAAD